MPTADPVRHTVRQRRRAWPFAVNSNQKVSGSSVSRSSTTRAPSSEISEIEHGIGGVVVVDYDFCRVMKLPPRFLAQFGARAIIRRQRPSEFSPPAA